MTIKPLGHQSLHRAPHRQLGICNLALDDGVKGRMRFRPWNSNPGAAMVIHHGIDTFLLVQSKPSIRIRLHERIIFGNIPFWVLNRRCDKAMRIIVPQSGQWLDRLVQT